MLRMVGFGDNIGFGFRKIMNAWKNIGFPNPYIHEEYDVNEVWLTLPIGSLAEDNNDEETNNVASNVKESHVSRKSYDKLCKEVVRFCVDGKTRH